MSKIKLEKGMRMKCAMYGEGEPYRIRENIDYGIDVFFPQEFPRPYNNIGIGMSSRLPTLKLLNIPFTEGLEVECDIYGKGVVTKIHENIMYQKVQVSFEGKLDQYYTEDGRISGGANQTLFPQYEI